MPPDSSAPNRQLLARLSIVLEEWHNQPLFDPDTPAYLVSGDPDDMECTGWRSHYRALLLDDEAKKRLVLECDLSAYEQLVDRILAELRIYLLKNVPPVNTPHTPTTRP